MDKNQIIKYAAIAGGAYLAYWYVTSYGPGGHVSTGVLSYWDTWFGGTQPAAAPVQQAGTPQPAPQAVVTQPSAAAPPVNAAVRQQILTASAGDPSISGGYAVPDVWSYWWQKVTGKTISGAQMLTMFPPTAGTTTGAPLSLDQFLSKLPSAGLSGGIGVGSIVTTRTAPSIPSMNFGGSFRTPGMRGMGGRGMKAIMAGNTPGPGGQTIQ